MFRAGDIFEAALPAAPGERWGPGAFDSQVGKTCALRTPDGMVNAVLDAAVTVQDADFVVLRWRVT